jgi:hypothetical protein
MNLLIAFDLVTLTLMVGYELGYWVSGDWKEDSD